MEEAVRVIDELGRRPPLRADRFAGGMQGIGLERDESPVLHHRDRAASRDAERAVARDALGRRHEGDYEERRAPVSTFADVYGRIGFGYGVAMNSRWDDNAASNLTDLDLLVYASRLIGAETSLVVWGGGNTSVKRVERDHRGRDVSVLRVKGSGSDLKSIQKKDFPGVRMDDILALLERDQMEDQAMVDYFARALLDPSSSRPSIETPLHGFLPVTAVIHTHADAIVSLTNNDRCPDVLKEVFGDQVVSLAYLRPGFPIARQVAQAFAAHPRARAILLEKHGTICWGDSVKDAYLSTIELISRAEEAIAHKASGRVRFGGVEVVQSLSPAERRRVAVAVAPALRG